MAYALFAVLAILLVFSPFIQSDIIEYTCPAQDGPVDYTLHDLYNDGVRVQNTSAISFQVKCEKNAYILLQEHRHDYKKLVVEIIFGTSKNYGISISDKQSRRSTLCRIPYIVSKHEYRYFWVSWENNVVHVGRGNTPNIRMLPCSERISHTVNYVSIGTANYTKGNWRFNTGMWTAKTSTTTKMLQDSSTTPSTTSKAENDFGNDEGHLTSDYIAVPLTLIVVAFVVAAILVIRRYQRCRKPEPDVVYENTGNETPVVNINLTSGIENPAYDEHILETQSRAHRNSGEMPISNDKTCANINLTEEQTEQETTRKNSHTLQTDHTQDGGHIYNHLVKQNDRTSVETTSKTEVKYKQYQHVACVTGHGNDDQTDLGEVDIDKEKSHTKPVSDIGVTENMDEDTSTLYDHATSGTKSPTDTDIVTDEYSHLNDVMNNREVQSSETPSQENVNTSNTYGHGLTVTKDNISDGYETVAVVRSPLF